MENKQEYLEQEKVVNTAETLFDRAPASGLTRFDGWFDRNKFNPLLLSLIFIVLAFLSYTIASMFGLVAFVGFEVFQNLETLGENVEGLLLANAVGQFLGLALVAWIWAGWNSRSTRSEFLRLRTPNWGLVGLSLLGLAALFPIVQWLGQINEMIPMPDFVKEMEGGQIEMLEKALLEGNMSIFLSLFAIAITPAICEELAFRGYLQRQVERRLGGMGAVIVVGIIFGLFHLRLSGAIPLSALGIYMGYVSWKTGSLWTAIIVHFVNNGFLTIAAKVAQNSESFDAEAIDELKVPLYLVFIAVIIFFLIMTYFNKRVKELTVTDTGIHE